MKTVIEVMVDKQLELIYQQAKVIEAYRAELEIQRMDHYDQIRKQASICDPEHSIRKQT